MTTARDLISLASKAAGLLGVGQTLLAEDVNDILFLLGAMTGQWNKRRWLVPALVDIKTIGNNNVSNTIGLGGYWNVPRPNDIKGGYVIQLNTGQLSVSLPLEKIFSYEDYIKIAVKGLNTLPDHFFYDGAFSPTGTNGAPLGNVFIWPIPSALYECHLLVQAYLNFPIAATNPPTPNSGLDTTFRLPDEYIEAILYNLAIRICANYTLPASNEIRMLAKSSLETIRAANTQIPTMGMPAGLRKGKAFNIFNADGY